MATYLITGSSRGLGLAMVSRLASLPQSEVSTIFATARQDNSARLRELVDSSSGRIGFVPLDVTDENSATKAANLIDRQLQGRGLDVLINNAGVMPVTRGGLEAMYEIHDSCLVTVNRWNTDSDARNDLNETFDTNVSGTHRVTKAFLPLLRRGQKKLVVNL